MKLILCGHTKFKDDSVPLNLCKKFVKNSLMNSCTNSHMNSCMNITFLKKGYGEKYQYH